MNKEQRDTLEELHHVVYNCEDMIDGEYNPDADNMKEFTAINLAHRRLKVYLHHFMRVIDDTIKEE